MNPSQLQSAWDQVMTALIVKEAGHPLVVLILGRVKAEGDALIQSWVAPVGQ